MNLFTLLNRGPNGTAILHQRKRDGLMRDIAVAAEASRQRWRTALIDDQTRVWMGIGEPDRDALSAMAIMLTIAGFCLVYDDHAAIDGPDLSVIRGAISAATQCSSAGSVLTVEHAQAFSSAATRALTIVEGCTINAICHAAEQIRLVVGIADNASQGVRAGAAL